MIKKRKNIFNRLIFFLVSAYLLIPLIATIINSFFINYDLSSADNFTLNHYAKLVTDNNSSILPVIWRTLFISVFSSFIMFVFVIFAMYSIKLYLPKLDKYLSVLSKIPYGINGVIVAVSILSLYSSGYGIFSNRIFLLVACYCIVILPYMYQGIKNALETVDMQQLLQAAEILGAGKLYSFIFIVIPATFRGLLATILLSIGILICDFVLVNILAGSYYPTLSIVLNDAMNKSGHRASAISVIIFIIMFALSIFVSKLNKENKRA